MPIDVSQVDKLAIELAGVPAKVEPEAARIVARTGYQVVGTAQVLAPVETGTLKSSISVDVTGLGFVAGPTVNYGHFLEDGTHGPYLIENAWGRGITVEHPGISAQPYMGPAFDQHVPGAVDAVEAAGRDALT